MTTLVRLEPPYTRSGGGFRDAVPLTRGPRLGVRIAALLPIPHPQDCAVCGGKGRVQVAGLRPREDRLRAAWIPARVVWCPLRSNADDLRALVGGAS